MDTADKVALITGANTGVGLALAQRLLHMYGENITICLACRNQQKAELARNYLKQEIHTAKIDLLNIDTSKIKSVLVAAKQVVQRYNHIDLVYLNAGILPVSGVDWYHLGKGVFSKDCVHMFATGDGLLRQLDNYTDDGLRQVFVTNCFGHLVFIQEIESCLGGVNRPSQLIWTSSSNASRKAFDINDLQHSQGKEPYGSSKYIIDMMSVALNEKYNSKSIYSHTTCPGLVMTNVTSGILPNWFWLLLLPFLWLLRIFVPSVTITPEKACHSLSWVSTKEPQSLDPLCKYHSCVSWLGTPYIKMKKMDIDADVAIVTYKKLEELQKEMKSKFTEIEGH